MTDEDPIAAAEAEADGVSPPPTPEGYNDPYQFEYPKLVLVVGSTVLGILSVVVYGWLLLQLQGQEALVFVFEIETEEGIGTGFDLVWMAIPLVVAFLTVAVVHELLHGVVFQRYGYDVNYGVYWQFGAVYAAVFHQFHTREHNLWVGIAPLTIITVVCLPLLAVPNSLVATSALFALALNTGGSMGDIYAFWRFYRMPQGTVFYDVNIDTMYVFEPN
ncbi:DUF3267 domain-containing protein [Natronococcus sp. A-GB1]|uniref:DUF3267 domain-containing protein n=1 Tax=Natronococcus sp. A-GB1 TaxID=3037648 RepID=UPI00241FFC67|nr:DUF3267 domain-containing protein [Natronococcus sp. A-GB1]MDG5759670.1 DUF3267 domain-containing protein [Natronococcus sp. A-GB1]